MKNMKKIHLHYDNLEGIKNKKEGAFKKYYIVWMAAVCLTLQWHSLMIWKFDAIP